MKQYEGPKDFTIKGRKFTPRKITMRVRSEALCFRVDGEIDQVKMETDPTALRNFMVAYLEGDHEGLDYMDCDPEEVHPVLMDFFIKSATSKLKWSESLVESYPSLSRKNS